MKIIINPLITIAILFINVSCSGLFEYSPYGADVKTHNLNVSEIGNISDKLQVTDTFKFALISDPHENYDDLADAIASINQQNNLQFVACCGDVTNSGLAQEYNWYFNTILKSQYPLLTVIGNHDYLSNGYTVFQKLFGPSNMSFISGAYKFILFDDVIWENNNQSPNYDWLINELNDSAYYHILLTHIPPWTDQMDGDNNVKFTQIVNANNTVLCLHGHEHTFTETTYNGIPSVVSGCVKDGGYSIISLTGNKAQIKRINF